MEKHKTILVLLLSFLFGIAGFAQEAEDELRPPGTKVTVQVSNHHLLADCDGEICLTVTDDGTGCQVYNGTVTYIFYISSQGFGSICPSQENSCEIVTESSTCHHGGWNYNESIKVYLTLLDQEIID